MTTPLQAVDTVRALFADASLLIRQEIRLAKAEAEEKIEQAQSGIVSIAASLIFALVALMVLVQALVVALGNIMQPSLAALSVGLVLAVIALLFMAKGKRDLKPKNLAPRRTLKSVRENAEKIREAA